MHVRAMILIVLLATAANAAETGNVITNRMSLIEAIDATREDGIAITYSSRLVEPWMRVRMTPSTSDPLGALVEALAPYALALEPGPGGVWLVVKGDFPVKVVNTDVHDAEPLSQLPAEPEIDEVTIVASRYSLFESRASSDQFLTGEEIRLLPHIADDAFRAFHRLPGAAANDFSAPFNLRGGAVGEVKVVLDGLELFEPYHMRTLFSPLSIVDPGIIGDASVLSGGYTAEHGNHMSGVIDITSERPGGEPVHEVGVSFVSSFVRSSGAFGDRGTYQFAARRGYLDLLADTVTEGDEELSPQYSDAFVRVGYALNEATEIAVHGLFASDDVDFVDPDDGEDFGGDSNSYYTWVTVDMEPNDRVRWRNVLSLGRVENREIGALRNPPFESTDREFARDVEVSGLQSDLSLHASDSQLWMFGARYRHLEADYDYQIDSIRQTDFVNNGFPFGAQRQIITSSEGDELGVYARYRFQPSRRQTWELGLRWDKQTYTDTADDTQLSPRVNALFRLTEGTDLRLGWGHYYQPQGVQELQVEDGVTNFFPAERAEHRVVGVRHRFRSDLELQLDLYQKVYRDLRPRFENALDTYEFAAESNFDRLRIEAEDAEALGAELTLRNSRANGQAAGLDWWLNYTWSKAEDTIEGVAVPRSWDQRHAVTGNLTWRGEKWMLSLVGRYHSGWPRTPLLLSSLLDAGGALISIDSDLSQRNRNSFDDYYRVDARLSRTVDLTRGSFQYYFEIFNLFDTENQCCVPDHDISFGQSVTVSPNIDDYLPFFPSFGFVWTFGPGA